jgi:DNA polymerase III alpha subunit
VPYFINKIRQVSTHAGGVCITPEPIYHYIPVDRVAGELITAFPESGQESVLDSVGIIKLDLLAITVLEVIDRTVEMINEKMYLVEEDGIKKIVGESYLSYKMNDG